MIPLPHILALPAEDANPSSWSPVAIGIVIFFLIVLLIIFGVLFQMLGLYLRAYVSGAPISMLDVIGMRLRKIDARRVTNTYVVARREKLPVDLNALQAHVLVGGDVEHCVSAMVVAQRGGTPLSWQDVTTLDLAGRDAIAYAKQGAPARPGTSLVASAPMRREAAAAMNG